MRQGSDLYNEQFIISIKKTLSKHKQAQILWTEETSREDGIIHINDQGADFGNLGWHLYVHAHHKNTYR